jgi:hypothetical protein
VQLLEFPEETNPVPLNGLFWLKSTLKWIALIEIESLAINYWLGILAFALALVNFN